MYPLADNCNLVRSDVAVIKSPSQSISLAVDGKLCRYMADLSQSNPPSRQLPIGPIPPHFPPSSAFGMGTAVT